MAYKNEQKPRTELSLDMNIADIGSDMLLNFNIEFVLSRLSLSMSKELQVEKKATEFLMALIIIAD